MIFAAIRSTTIGRTSYLHPLDDDNEKLSMLCFWITTSHTANCCYVHPSILWAQTLAGRNSRNYLGSANLNTSLDGLGTSSHARDDPPYAYRESHNPSDPPTCEGAGHPPSCILPETRVLAIRSKCKSFSRMDINPIGFDYYRVPAMGKSNRLCLFPYEGANRSCSLWLRDYLRIHWQLDLSDSLPGSSV